MRTLAAATALIAAALGWYVRTVERSAGPVPYGLKLIIPIDLRIVDDETGAPVPGAEVHEPFLHPDWDDDPEMREADLRSTLPGGPTPPLRADGGGRARIHAGGSSCRLLRRGAYGLFPYAGDPEVVFHPVHGVRVRAAGYEPWTRRLEVLRREAGLPLGTPRPFASKSPLPPVMVRLKKARADPAGGRAAPP